MAGQLVRSVAACVGLLCATAPAVAMRVGVPARQARVSTAANGAPPRAILDKYCVTCHNERLKRGNLVLETLEVERVGSNIEIWEKVVTKLRSGVMPPLGAPRPDKPTYQALIRSLEDRLDRHAATAPDPGRSSVHRLNRAEYTNAIRDLLALEINGKALLPADNSGYGFDNVADVLTMSPALLERYLLAAKKISRLAIGDPSMRPTTVVYDVPYLTLVQEGRMSEELPFGSRGGVAMRHYFPLDGEYEIKIRLQRNTLGIGYVIRGLDVENLIDLRVDGVRVKLFTMGVRSYGDGPYLQTEDVADAGLRARIQIRAGTRVVGVALNNDTFYVEGVGMSRLPVASDGYASGRHTTRDYGRIEMGIDHVEIAGPFDGRVPARSASRRRIFVCQAASPSDEEACATTILASLARRAYRRPLAEADIQRLMEFYRNGRTASGSFDGGIEKGLVRILTDLNFLFRVEQDPAKVAPGGIYRISDLELASRLSFFLWSSIPDDELLAVAAEGRLHTPAVLAQQVRRMLADSKAKALVQNFFGQWLLVRNMGTVRPDPKAFPDFDENLRQAFQQETELFLESQLRENSPITDIITADYTFVNERLARHYGIPNVYGSHFRHITLPPALQRGGLLGHGSLLTVTSYADRTSVVIRGKFILENLLGTPPPPPPPNVPPLENTKVEGSLRQRMEMHRKNPVCANCHAQLDPMGFALEHFNGVGRWRVDDGKVRIDASGALPDGTKFDGPASFRAALMQHQDAFVTTLTQKLLTYALGRGVEAYDMPAVRTIIRNTAAGGNTWSTLIVNITRSLPFQMRRSES